MNVVQLVWVYVGRKNSNIFVLDHFNEIMFTLYSTMQSSEDDDTKNNTIAASDKTEDTKQKILYFLAGVCHSVIMCHGSIPKRENLKNGNHTTEPSEENVWGRRTYVYRNRIFKFCF